MVKDFSEIVIIRYQFWEKIYKTVTRVTTRSPLPCLNSRGIERVAGIQTL
jgi:hypothetical protein